MGTSATGSTHSCDRCGAMVTDRDLQQGLAVRIGNDLVCPVCVEGLPGDAQLKINQLRAMRGMDSTTYRVVDKQRPQVNFFTFSTSSNILRHRHELRDSGEYNPPLLPDRQRTVSHRAEAKEAAAEAIQRTQRERLLRWWPVAAVAGALLLGILVFSLGSPESSEESPAEQAARVAAAAEERLREELQEEDPLSAWPRARAAFAADDPLVVELVAEVRQSLTQQLDEAEQALDSYALSRAQTALNQSEIPPHEPRFAGLRERRDTLQQRLTALQAPRPEPIAEQPAPQDPVPEDPVPEDPAVAQQPEPQPNDEDSTAANTDKAEDEVEPSPADQPSAADEPPLDIAELTAFRNPLAFMLLASGSSDAWDEQTGTNYRLRLDAPSGVLSRELTLPEGRWRIWLLGHNSNPEAAVYGRFGSTTVDRQAAHHPTQYRWFPLDGELALEKESTLRLSLTFDAPDEAKWYLKDIMISDARVEAEEDIQQLAQGNPPAAAWTPIPRPEDLTPDRPPQPQHLHFDRSAVEGDFYTIFDTWNPNAGTDGERAMAPLLPGNTGRIVARSGRSEELIAQAEYRSPRSALRQVMVNKGQVIALDMQGTDLSHQHLIFLLNPYDRFRRQRQRLEVYFTDQRDIVSPEALLLEVDPEKEWQTAAVRIPARWLEAAQEQQQVIDQGGSPRTFVFNPQRIKRAFITDPSPRNTSPFFISRLSIAHDDYVDQYADSAAGPAESVLALRPRALIRASVPPRNTLRQRRLDPDKVRVLAGIHFRPEWRTDIRKGLADILDLEAMPQGAVVALQMHNPALDREFIKEYLDDVDHHVVLVVTGGIEAATGLNLEQSLRNFWEKMLVEAQRSNFLPVAVLGPTKVDPEHNDMVNKLWDQLEDMIRNDQRFAGVPIIDLRPARALQGWQFAPGGRQMSIDLLLDGYRELRGRLHLAIDP